MRVRREVERGRLAPGAHDDVFGLARAVGHRVVEDVGHVGELRTPRLFESRQGLLRGGDPGVERGELRPQFAGRGRFVGGPPDRGGDRVLLGFERFERGQRLAMRGIAGQHAVDEAGALPAP